MAKEEQVPNRKRQGSDESFCYELISFQLVALPETQTQDSLPEGMRDLPNPA